jgi:hypothetical protein
VTLNAPRNRKIRHASARFGFCSGIVATLDSASEKLKFPVGLEESRR